MTAPPGWGPRLILVSALSGAALTLVVAWLLWRAADGDSEHFPTWLEAVATVAAFSAAIVAAFYAARAFVLEFQREARFEESLRKSQAALVAAWFGVHEFDNDPVGGTTPLAGALLAAFGKSYELDGVYLRNASDLPVGGVSVEQPYPRTVRPWARSYQHPDLLFRKIRGTSSVTLEARFRKIRALSGGRFEPVLDHEWVAAAKKSRSPRTTRARRPPNPPRVTPAPQPGRCPDDAEARPGASRPGFCDYIGDLLWPPRGGVATEGVDLRKRASSFGGVTR